MKIEVRKTCKICGNPVPKRFRTYCSGKCRNKFHNKKHYPLRKAQARAKRGAYSPDKRQCLICGNWYVQVGSHVVQMHGYEAAKEYKDEFDLPLSKGVIPTWYKKLKGDIALENDTWKNTQTDNAKATRYKAGDERAKVVTGWKGRRGSKGYQYE